MLLILTCGISGKAADFTKVYAKSAGICRVSTTLSSCSSTSSRKIKQGNSKFVDARFSWTADAELDTKPLTEVYSSNQRRIHRVIENNIFLRDIFLILFNHEGLLIHGRTRQYFSDKDPYYAVTSSDYYIYTLRRILI